MDARRHASSRKLTDDARRGAPWPHQPAWSVSFFALACVEFSWPHCATPQERIYSITVSHRRSFYSYRKRAVCMLYVCGG